MKTFLTALTTIWLFLSCTSESYTPTLTSLTTSTEKIAGKTEYLNSPFVTAGNRLYLVGYQNGDFPEIGWHIPGEMGGLWAHPIKLLDGFDLRISAGNQNTRLDAADTFVNLPFANMHEFHLEAQQLEVQRWQFIPDNTEGLVVEYLITNTSDDPVSIQTEFTAYSDLRPTWLGERTNMQDGTDSLTIEKEEDLMIFRDTKNEWTVAVRPSIRAGEIIPTESPYKGLGTAGSFLFTLDLEPGKQTPLRFYIAGSANSGTGSLNTLNSLKDNWPQLLNEKSSRYQELARSSELTIPDKDLENAFRWLKYNSDWLVRTVPGIGTGIGAGIPDYPWWFGVDSEYALQGYMMVGQSDVVFKTIDLLNSISMEVNGNGRIVHEVSTNGAVFNRGNINETPQFATLIRTIYDWSGDREFAEKYFPTVKMGMQWLEREKDADGNGFPDGFGMMEIHGLNSEMIDVAVYTCKAYADAAYLAGVLEEDSLAGVYAQKAERLKEAINTRFWSEPFHSYADFIGTDAQALQLTEDAITRADTLNKPWAVEELKNTREQILDHPSDRPRPFVLHHNWVVNTPMETGIAPRDKALKALETARKFINPFGVFVTGIDRDESAGSDTTSFKGSKVFSYTGAVMTLPTGVQAIAENNYGRPDYALDYLKRMTRTFGYALPGSIYEVSPDYGMMTQAWNIYSFAVPIIGQFFGLQPRAATRTLVISPQMPSSWDAASLTNVAVADGTVNLDYAVKDDMLTYAITHTLKNWETEVMLPRSQYEKPALQEGTYEVVQEGDSWILKTSEKRIALTATLIKAVNADLPE